MKGHNVPARRYRPSQKSPIPLAKRCHQNNKICEILENQALLPTVAGHASEKNHTG